MFSLNKLSLIITTRCNLRCSYCCEYVPQNKPFPDMTLEEEERILTAAFDIFDHVDTLHLTGGGEPFLHKELSEMIENTMVYSDRFDRLMLFTNCTIPMSEHMKKCLLLYKEKLFIQLSQYGINPEREQAFVGEIEELGVPHRVRKYYGEEQTFGGWVDFGDWNEQGKSDTELSERFRNCAVTAVMHGNWRTRDGKVHWCSRSQRGAELGLFPCNPEDYVDLFDSSSIDEKRAKFLCIENSKFISACNYCSGDSGTKDTTKRFAAAEQIRGEKRGENKHES